MKWFAYYLPQFHETEENNEWWGKGFTEWTHVNAAKPLIKGHLQPIKPKDDNYYNLMDKNTVEWQTSLMKEYGIDGLVYYHYYFCGKKLLNKPAENLLKWTDINQPFFFCWANHSWYKAVDGVKNLLIEQKYGGEKEWEEHFLYLLPFFKDARYEKRNNKPVFMLFINFPEKKDLFNYFDRRCREEGFDGICLIESFMKASRKNSFDLFKEDVTKQTELICLRQPDVARTTLARKRRFLPVRVYKKIKRILTLKGVIKSLDKFSGQKFYKIMQRNICKYENVCHGVFFSWDNTPRHKYRGFMITPPKKEQFMQYADKLKSSEYVFINAWNEWAEGMILEPTEHNGFKYLEWIKEWKEINGFIPVKE